MYWISAGGIFLISCIPGFFMAYRFKNFSVLEKYAISFGFSFVVLLLPMPFFAFKLLVIGWGMLIMILIFSLIFFIEKRKDFILDYDVRFIFFIFIIGIAIKLFLQIFWEYPVIGGDWFSHAFLVPHSFSTDNWNPPRDRTSFFSLLVYAYHGYFNVSLYQYWFSQIFSVVVNSIYIVPAYLIAKKVFNSYVAKISALFMLVTPFLVFQTLYTWPKNAAMYGILMMIYFLFFSDQHIKIRYLLAGFFAGLGFWFHNYALIYISIAVLLLIVMEKWHKNFSFSNIIRNIKKISYFLAPLFIVLLPFFIWTYAYYGTISSSKFFYYPIAVNGYDFAFNNPPNELWRIFRETPLKDIIVPRMLNSITTFTPATLPINRIITRHPHYNAIYYYSHDYPGALSTMMYILVVFWFLRYVFKKTKTHPVFVGFIFLSAIAFLFVWAWKEWGLLTSGFHPIIPLFIMIGINELYSWKTKYKRFFIYILFISAIIEDIIFSVLIRKFYGIEGGIQQLVKTGQQYISDFQVSQFVSAHFLMKGNMDILYSFLILTGIFFLSCMLLRKKAL
jgi:hypothetical protein